MSSVTEYQKLPGAGFCKGSMFLNVGAPSRSFASEDHLLIVDSQGPALERYRRLPWADIEAITMVRTNEFLFKLVIHLSGTVIGLGLILSDGLFAVFAGWVFCTLFGIAVLIELAKGPTARTRIRTRVQEVELGSCNRWRAATKTLALIEPRIQAAQDSEKASSPPETPVSDVRPPTPPPPPSPHPDPDEASS